MVKHEYCPECNIGLNSREVEMRICMNCRHSWEYEEEGDMYDEDYEYNQRLVDDEVNDINDW